MSSIKKKTNIPEWERAFVFAGGGSLGAYEAGAYKSMCEFIKKRDEAQGIKGKAVFDTIAGTSIGAMNAASSGELCCREWNL